MHVQRLVGAAVRLVPDLRLQRALADDFAGSAREQRDQGELLAAQVEGLPVEPRLARAGGDPQAADRQRLSRLRAGGAPENGPDPRVEMIRCERLDDVI